MAGRRLVLKFCLFRVIIPGLLSANIFVNQLGFLPQAPKYVFINQPSDSFQVCRAGDDVVGYKDRLNLFSTVDPATGMTLYLGDFSGFTAPGVYYCKSDGGDTSPYFTIADSVYAPLYRKSLKAFYFQRCGIDLLGSTVGNYYHSRCHIADGMFHSTTGYAGYHFARSGWHDAGDYGKYIVNAGISAGTLLMAYEYFPGKFNQDNLNILESGNGIPDILDEVRFELEWMLTMQDSSGGVFHKLTREQFAPFIMPQNDSGTRYIYEISSAATADFCAVMARAARIYSDFDTAFSDTCLNAAVMAWDYLSSHPTIQPAGGFTNPPGTVTGEYGDSNDSDERLWSAAELYLTTGEAEFHLYYMNNYSAGGLINSAMSWQNVRTLAHITYLNGSRPDMNTGIQDVLRNSLNSYCQGLLIRRSSNGFFVTLNPGEYWWGCNSSVLNNAILLIMGYEQLNNELFKNAALDQSNYILGCNGNNISFVTGSGTISPMYPHHRPSASDGNVEPIPGLLVGGPDQYLSDPVLQLNFSASTPPALCYIDDEGSYASNEIAINWNAPLVLVSGYFARDSQSRIKGNNNSIIPGEIKLEQNFPNPFNSDTRIIFNLALSTFMRLEVFDLHGKRIKVLYDGYISSGNHSLFFDAASFPSGVYWYKLSAAGESMNRKMVLIK
jgi:endoglucanase